MSSIKLQGSTSGEITIAAPAVAGTNTLTLPASTGTIITDTAPKVGNVLQVVTSEYSTITSISSTSYTNSGLSASITPSSTSSKILVIASLSGRIYSQQNGDRVYYIRIARGGTEIHFKAAALQAGVGSAGYYVAPIFSSLVDLDSPSTTSSITYTIDAKVNNTANATNVQFCSESSISTLTLMEIAG